MPPLQFETIIDEIESWERLLSSPQEVTTDSLIMAWRSALWLDVQKLAFIRFQRSTHRAEKSLLLFTLISSAEIEFDTQKRFRFLELWNEIKGWSQCAYSRHLYIYNQALTVFFSGHLFESERLFDQALEEANTAGYVFGEIRCLFHLGLVKRDQQDSVCAQSFFRRAHALATLQKWPLYIQRIVKQLNMLTGAELQIQLGNEASLLENLLTQKDFLRARKFYLQISKQLKASGVHRQSESFYVFVPLILFGLTKPKLASIIEHSIKDPVLKFAYLKLKDGIFGLTDSDRNELRLFSRLTYHTQTPTAIAQNPKFVAGLKLSSIQNTELRIFFELMLNSKTAVSKEEIFSHIWGTGYDPVIHDQKIYKLVMRAKKLFSGQQIIKNEYGTYRLVI